MGIWNEGGFFSSVKGHVIKWWQLVMLPVLRIDHNQRGKKSQSNVLKRYDENREGKEHFTEKKASRQETAEDNIVETENADPLEVMRRIERENEEKKQRDVENARKKAQEQEQIDAIMQANKVDVNAFIEEGKAMQDSTEISNTTSAEYDRAMEILERLNREAAEDQAKKAAEIETAKRQAKEKFG